MTIYTGVDQLSHLVLDATVLNLSLDFRKKKSNFILTSRNLINKFAIITKLVEVRHFFLQRVNVTRYKLLHHFRGILELSLVIIIIIKFSFIYIYILFYKTKYPFFQNQNNQSLLIQLNKMEIIINKNIKRSKQKTKINNLLSFRNLLFILIWETDNRLCRMSFQSQTSDRSS